MCIKKKTFIGLADPCVSGETRSYGEVATSQITVEQTLLKITKSRSLTLPDIDMQRVWPLFMVRSRRLSVVP
jgi:hypothetical protein